VNPNLFVSAFIWALETALGDDVVNDHVITYVDDLLIHYQVYENLLVRTQPVPDAIKGMTSTFMHVFEEPYVITKLLDHSAYELRDESGKLWGEFNKKQLRRYQEADGETQILK